MDYKNIIELSSALLTPTIAIITTYIAIQQYRNERAKSRHELYEKRLKIYYATTRYIRRAHLSERLLPDDILAFTPAKGESCFLFGKDVTGYLAELDDKGMRLHGLQLILLNMPELRDSQEMNNEIKEMRDWFKNQEDKATSTFMKYLNLQRMK